ncbi:conserved hypothetical protein [Ricinus communis]|uniref:F-box associated domain-containing protein n=1 Tax=Ricinus communis TaxID=3988 RepID=B9T5F8_RICCO|nr:conserved hypothetical protein [Ricinus communis]
MANYCMLSELGGCLCMSNNVFAYDHVDIWIVKEYGVEESWTKSFSIPKLLDNVLFDLLMLRLMLRATIPAREHQEKAIKAATI